ncbi:adenylosuccinate synthetase, partial [Salmonella enterica subsp. enterica serovar Anatum]|nr:adenylosuccinate synthetase [Salmonella enterica subsp. enterica serovar Anatum]
FRDGNGIGFWRQCRRRKVPATVIAYRCATNFTVIIVENNRAACGIPVRERLLLSEACPLILDYHVALDNAREKARGAKAIGTTGR